MAMSTFQFKLHSAKNLIQDVPSSPHSLLTVLSENELVFSSIRRLSFDQTLSPHL